MLKEQLMQLKNALKYYDFEVLVKEWKESFENFYKQFYSDCSTEYECIWKVCRLLESIKAESLAKAVLFLDDNQVSKSYKEVNAFYILLSQLFIDSRKTKEEFFREIDNFIKEENND